MSKAYMDAAATIRSVMSRVSVELSDKDRRVLVATALARAISLCLPVPSQAVDSITGYFATSHDNQVCEIVSKLNEQYLIDTQLARDLTYKFYRLRYDLVHDPMTFTALLPVLAKHAHGYFSEDVVNVVTKELNKENEITPWYFDTWQNLVRTLTVGISQGIVEDSIKPVSYATM